MRSLQALRYGLSTLPIGSHERRIIMQETANLYGVSEQTLYRALAQRAPPRALRRSGRGTPRVLPQESNAFAASVAKRRVSLVMRLLSNSMSSRLNTSCG
jgi:hypothetical protein